MKSLYGISFVAACIGIASTSVALIGAPAVAQDSNPDASIRREESRIIDSYMDCMRKHAMAGENTLGNTFSDCTAQRKADEAKLAQKRQQNYISQQQAQAKDSSVKFHYNGKYYVDLSILQAYSMGVGNYVDVVGRDIVVPAAQITQVNRRDGKYWGYMGATAACVSDTPIAISLIVPVSASGKVRGTVVSTIVRGHDRAQTNTVVIDNCRVGPAEDEDQLWSLAQGGR